MTIAAVVLAGGSASRLGGGDKGLLDLGGRPLLAWIIAALGPDVARLAISANGDPARFEAFGLPVLPDGAFAGEGPLAGVLASLDWAHDVGAKTLLTVPADTPFVPPGLVAALAPAPACAASLGRLHRLTALWPVAARETLRRLLSVPGPRAVARFTDMIGMRPVDFPAGTRDSFFNINTAEDLATARRLAGSAHDRQCRQRRRSP